MENNILNPFSGIVAMNWPGKMCRLSFTNGKWRLIPDSQVSKKTPLIFDSRVGCGNHCAGYAIKADIMSALEMLHPYLSAKVQFIYFDAPRLNVFQNITEPGYTISTWLSMVQQAALRSNTCLTKKGFFAVHTDEQMVHYARVVLDEVFGTSHYIGTFVWQKQYAPQNDLNIPTDVLDYITVYSHAPTDEIEKIGVLVTPKDLKDDGDFRGCYIDGHKGARSGNEATKFRINTSPYHWEIVDSYLPKGRFHFDKILGSLYFESVEEEGDFYVKVVAVDKVGNTDERTISFKVRPAKDMNDVYHIHNRIWWLFKDDNDITKKGDLRISDLPESELVAICGQEFSLVFKAVGGEPFTMRSDAPGTGRYWEFGKRTLVEGIARAMASFGGTGSALPSIKKYFDRDNAKKRQTVMNFLPWYDFGHTQDATQHCRALKSAGLIDGEVNMMAKPQRLLSHLISLLAPNSNDTIMSLGENNGVFSSVAIKRERRFVHIIGSSAEELKTWTQTASKRILSVLEGKDTIEIEGNDTLPEATQKQGYIDVLKPSKSYLEKNSKNGNIEPFFDDDELIEDVYAGLAGAYRVDSSGYISMDDRKVVVIAGESTLDTMLLERIKMQNPSKKLVVIYESSENDVYTSKHVVLKRAPFDLI